MAYTIITVGLVCFVERTATEYLVALPNGLNVKSRCNGKNIHPHKPFLIIPAKDVVNADIQGRVRRGCLVYELEAFKSVVFDFGNSAGTFDSSNHQAKMHRWTNLDAGFDIDPDSLKKTIISGTLKRGVFLTRRLPGADSLLSEITVPTDGAPFNVKLDGKNIEISNDAEVVLANVAPQWVEDIDYPDDDDQHFFIYYELGTVASPTCKLPPVDSTVPESKSDHPFIKEGRGLRVSCANTIFP